jgi:hypothetical protein
MIWPPSSAKALFDDQVFVCDIDALTEVNTPLSKMLASTV